MIEPSLNPSFAADPLETSSVNYWDEFFRRMLGTLPSDATDPLSGLDIPLSPTQTDAAPSAAIAIEAAVKTFSGGKLLLLAALVAVLVFVT